MDIYSLEEAKKTDSEIFVILSSNNSIIRVKIFEIEDTESSPWLIIEYDGGFFWTGTENCLLINDFTEALYA